MRVFDSVALKLVGLSGGASSLTVDMLLDHFFVDGGEHLT
jgi:hypothetical protein